MAYSAINYPIAKESLLDFQIFGLRKIVRPEGYTLPGSESLAIEVSCAGISAEGYGEGIPYIAKEKAISEAFERWALKAFCREHGLTETSNGWAAHTSSNLAIQNAFLELIERDVALSVWQNGGPFYEIPKSLWPISINEWRSNLRRPEFFDLKIWLSSSENGACVSALLFNENGNFVVGHASSIELNKAIISATTECMRAAHSATQFEYFSDVLSLHSKLCVEKINPGAHSLAYAYKVELPKDINVISANTSEILFLWEKHQLTVATLNMNQAQIYLFQIRDRVVARVKCEKYQQIFWGQDSNNHLRKNKLSHFVG